MGLNQVRFVLFVWCLSLSRRDQFQQWPTLIIFYPCLLLALLYFLSLSLRSGRKLTLLTDGWVVLILFYFYFFSYH